MNRASNLEDERQLKAELETISTASSRAIVVLDRTIRRHNAVYKWIDRANDAKSKQEVPIEEQEV